MMLPSEEKGAESEGPPTLPHPNIHKMQNETNTCKQAQAVTHRPQAGFVSIMYRKVPPVVS